MLRSRPWYLWALGGVLWVTVALLVLGITLPLLTSPYERARKVCVVCGAREWRTSFGPIVLAREPMEPVGGGWWEAFAPAGHPHEWHTFGCVQGYRMVSCTMVYEDATFLATLPRLPDQELARAVARRLEALDPEERWRELRDSPDLGTLEALGRPTGEAGRAPEADSSTGSAIEAIRSRIYQEWLGRHPLWQDLFPASLQDLGGR